MPYIAPILNFNGKCSEAIDLYRRAFKGKVEKVIRYGECNNCENDILNEYIYHAELNIGTEKIFLADDLEMPDNAGNPVTVSVMLNEKEDVIHAFEVLKEDCKSVYYINETPYCSCNVSIVDKYGFKWYITEENT